MTTHILSSTEEFLPLIEKAHFELNKLKYFNNGQIIVCLTAKGNMHHVIVTDICTMCNTKRDIEFIDTLKQIKDCHIKKLICMWVGESFDLPSYLFRKALCDASKENLNAEILLQGENIYIKKTIAQTL